MFNKSFTMAALILLLLAVVAITNPYWKQIDRGVRRLFGGTPAV